VEHVQPLDRPFPWRAAALAVGAVALVELAVLLVLAGLRLAHVDHAAAGKTAGTRPAAVQPPSTKPKTHPLQPRSHVSVLVLNGNGIAHAAGTEADRLLGDGYRHTGAADAPTRYGRSLVLYRPGWEREARRLAHDAGIAAIAPLDGRLPRSQARYQLVLILGVR
jgi:LytR cell envelope-related transcriptional attenuator